MFNIKEIILYPLYKLISIELSTPIKSIDTYKEVSIITSPLQWSGDKLAIPLDISDVNSYLKGLTITYDAIDSNVHSLNNGTIINPWMDGVGVPSGDIGEIGAYYLQLPEAFIYRKITTTNWDRIGTFKGDIGIQGIQGAQGIKGSKGDRGDRGERGAQGIQGLKGLDGTYIWDGNSIPSSNLGLKGDLFLHLTDTIGNGDFYRKVSDSVWERVGNVQGAKGDTGLKGSSIHCMTGLPNDSIGNKGDLYIQLDKVGATKPYDLYTRLDNGWTRIGNIKGEDGISAIDDTIITLNSTWSSSKLDSLFKNTLKFNSKGNLEITINGITKEFQPI